MIKNKAGLIPYFIEEDGSIKYMFMIPSKKTFGDRSPAIAKGGVEKGETTLQAALREAEEELGLNRINIDMSTWEKAFEGLVMGRIKLHHLTVYTVRVIDKSDFGPTVDETFATIWLTASGFKKSGYAPHKFIVQDICNKIETK